MYKSQKKNSHQDFKEEFYSSLKKLEKSTWTDFNSHDPGVTILDVLFYALTDLIYRTGFDIQDILASYQEVVPTAGISSAKLGPTVTVSSSSKPHLAVPKRPECFGIPTEFDSHFPGFEEVLQGSPITVFDYRKYMLDLVFKDRQDQFVARNIWFEKANKAELDVVNIGKILNIILEIVANQGLDDALQFLHDKLFEFPFLILNGLYEVVVELSPMIICEKIDKSEIAAMSREWEAKFGAQPVADGFTEKSLFLCHWYSISGNSFRAHLKPDDNPGGLDSDVFYSVEVTHPYFDEMQGLYKWNNPVANVSLIDDKLEKVVTPEQRYIFKGHLQVDFDGKDSETIAVKVEILGLCRRYTKALIDKTPDLGTPIPESIITALKDLLIHQTHLYLHAKIGFVIKALKELKAYYLASRNLCEDFVRFKAARVEEIAVNGVFAIEEGADVEAVLADLFFQLDRFISPPIKFSTFEQMEKIPGEDDPKRPFDEIFDGPLLHHGFIEDREIKKSDNVTAIYMSDLINIIMDVEGIAWVNNFSLSSFIDLEAMKTGEKNYLELSDPKLYKPKFTIEKSNVTVIKGTRKFHGIYDVDIMRVYVLIEEKKHTEKENQNPEKLREEKYAGLPQTPEGTKLDLMDYKSIQNEFPLVYGIGDHGLPKNASEKRKAQARQLKGYLFIIEQLLGNFLSQLSHTRALFSYREDVPNIRRTYFWKMLYEIPHLKEFISAYEEGKLAIPETMPDSTPSKLATHGTQHDPTPSSAPYPRYERKLKSIIENSKTFFERKGIFLDHLMARFGENLNEFQALLRKFVEDECKEQDPLRYGNINPNLFFIDRKIYYLQALPQLASNRSRAFNYCRKNEDGSLDIWDTDNISSLQKRLCHKLGLNNCCRRDLVVCEENSELLDVLNLSGDNAAKVSGKKAQKKPLKKQPLRYGPKMKGLVRKTREKIRPKSNKLINKNAPILPLKNFKVPDCLKALEGFYMIEHILLRPKFENQKMHLFFDENPLVIWDYDGHITDAESFSLEKFNFIEDPYSFHVTFIFPKAEGKFSDIEYQHYACRTIRNELPSHIIPHIFWLDKAFVAKFQEIYREWLNYLCVNPFLENVPAEYIIRARKTRKSLVLFLIFIWVLEFLDPSINPFD